MFVNVDRFPLVAWIPYVVKNKGHHCPNCRAYLGTYENA